MSSRIKKLLFLFVFCSLVAFALNLPVSTRQGINYVVSTKKIPLYLKLLDFFDRHYNYRQLVNELIKDVKTGEGRAIALLEWTNRNIRESPKGFPIVDDHVWHIIVRGFGTSDQSSDVFCTLCNYARLEAFYCHVYTKDRSSRILLSFVRLKDKWVVFDPYEGVYFTNPRGELASLEEIGSADYKIKRLTPSEREGLDYGEFLSNLPHVTATRLSRSGIQSPLRRFGYQIKKALFIKQKEN